MPTTVNEVAKKTEMLEIDPKTCVALKSTTKDETESKLADDEEKKEKLEDECESALVENKDKIVAEEEVTKDEEVAVEVEPKTGISFPVVLGDGKQLNAVGLRKKSMLGLGIKIYGFGTSLFLV